MVFLGYADQLAVPLPQREWRGGAQWEVTAAFKVDLARQRCVMGCLLDSIRRRGFMPNLPSAISEAAREFERLVNKMSPTMDRDVRTRPLLPRKGALH